MACKVRVAQTGSPVIVYLSILKIIRRILNSTFCWIGNQRSFKKLCSRLEFLFVKTERGSAGENLLKLIFEFGGAFVKQLVINIEETKACV